MSFLSALIPGPVGDFLAAPFQLRQASRELKNPNSAESADARLLGPADVTLPPAKRMVAALLRTLLVAAAVFALLNTQAAVVLTLPMLTMGLIAGAVSLPATLAVGGAYLVYGSVPTIIALVSAKTFSALGIQFALLAGGWLALKLHDILPVGVAESLIIEPISNKVAPSIVRAFG